MAKFNMNKLRGMSDSTDRGDVEKRATVGQGLLNEASRLLQYDTMKVKYIEIELIRKNEGNFYTIGDIDKLKKSIETIGLKQPLIVHRQKDGTYSLLGGERRLTAIQELMEEGKWPGTLVPCVLQEYARIDLPLPDEDKELYCIITTNREQREYTDADLMNEIRHLKMIYSKLRDAGVESIISGLDENGEEGSRTIKGVRTRDLISQDLNISTGKLAAFDKVENNGSEELIQAVQDNQISVAKAARIADLPKEEQKEALEQALKKEKEQKTDQQETAMVHVDSIEEDLKRIAGKAAGLKEVSLTGKEYKKYLSSVRALEKLLDSVQV